MRSSILASALVLSSALFGSFSLGGVSRAEAAELRVASYNVWGLPAPLTVRPSRFKVLVAEVPRTEVDLWAFQETFTAKASGLARLERFPHVAFGPGKSKTKISSGLLTISRFPIEETATVLYSRCAGTDCLANKGALYTKIRHPAGGVVHVFNTHLTSAGSDSVRDSQIQELLAFVGRQVSDSSPVILLGDYNFTPESQPYFRLLEEGKFQDAHDVYRWMQTGLSLEEWMGYTYDPSRNTNLKSQLFSHPSRIDFIWTRRQASGACGQVEVLRSSLWMDWKIDGRHLSDHFGRFAELSWADHCSAQASQP